MAELNTVMSAALWGCVLVGKHLFRWFRIAVVVISAPVAAFGETYGAWKFGAVDGFCAIGSASRSADRDTTFNIVVPSETQILLYVAQLGDVPNGSRLFGIRIDDETHWLTGAIKDGSLIYDLSAHPESSNILAEIMDGSALTLIGGLGRSVDTFSLIGSGRAVARLAQCVAENDTQQN